MKLPLLIALVGDYSIEVLAHRAIPKAFSLAEKRAECSVRCEWLDTASLADDSERRLRSFHGVWCTPGSPYRDMQAALRAIRFARERGVPFLGTCGGFQHAAIESARNVLGLALADHEESNANAEFPLVERLACSLKGKTELVEAAPGTRLARLYEGGSAEEQFNCSYGVSASSAELLSRAGFTISARSPSGEPWAIELANHPFFCATLFQPELAALRGVLHPLIFEFVRAARVRGQPVEALKAPNESAS